MTAPTPVTERPLRVKPSSGGAGWFWLCWPCTFARPGTGCGHADTAAAANDAARRHLVNDCPAVREATNRLIDDVLAVPEFRPVRFMLPGGLVAIILACLACGKFTTDAAQHVADHLEARDRAEGIER